MISTQRSTGSLFGEIRWRTPSSSTSAAVPGVEPSPHSSRYSKTSSGCLARALAHVVDLHRRVGVQVQLRRHLLGQPQPLAVLLEGQVGMDAALHAELGGAELDRLVDPRGEVLLGDLVGVGRALALAEAAEGAADDADVGEVDVAVDDERDPVPGQLGPQLVGGDPHLLDHLRPGLGEQRGQLVLGELDPLAPLGDRRLGQARRRASLRRAARTRAAE